MPLSENKRQMNAAVTHANTPIFPTGYGSAQENAIFLYLD
jgi:hypothetical protein